MFLVRLQEFKERILVSDDGRGAASAVVIEQFGERLLLDGRQLFRVQFVNIDFRLAGDLVVRLVALRTKRKVRLVTTHLPESPTDRGFQQ